MRRFATPFRQIRACFDEETITIYQAHGAQIARPAVASGGFVPPFRMEPDDPDQTIVLLDDVPQRLGNQVRPGVCTGHSDHPRRFRVGFAHSCLSHYQNPPYGGREGWEAHRRATPVRVQWDPERDIDMNRLGWRSIQIGLADEAVCRCVNEWTVDITGITGPVCEPAMRTDVSGSPAERPYPLSEELAHIIGAC